MTAGPAASRVLPAVRAAYGIVLLCAPGRALELVTGVPPSPRARRIVRVLGARHVVQAAMTANAGSAGLTLGAMVDGAHASSMLLLAGADRRMRPAGLSDATAALLFAAAGLGGARQAWLP